MHESSKEANNQYLLEIGLEEMPAGMILPAMEQLKKIDPKLQAAGNKKILTKAKISRIQKRLNSRVADIAKK